MNRRGFLKMGGAAGLITELSCGTARGYVPEHNWEKYAWGNGPDVRDLLYQGPFMDEIYSKVSFNEQRLLPY